MTEIEKLKEILDIKAEKYNHPQYIQYDPIQIPHQFSLLEDIEISGLLTSTIAWGQRNTIIKNAILLMKLMDNQPFEFITKHQNGDLRKLEGFIHRTFQADDLLFFIASLKEIYSKYVNLKSFFENKFIETGAIYECLKEFRICFLSTPHLKRSEKHISSVADGSAAKRLNMFLRWMVRKDEKGVDFGLWQGIPASALLIPLDLHTGNVSRKLGLLTRNQNDWKAVEELTNVLKKLDPNDPIKYDFALFGMGAFEK